MPSPSLRQVRTPGALQADGPCMSDALNLGRRRDRDQGAQYARHRMVDDVVLGCVDPVGEAAETRARARRRGLRNAVPESRSIASVPRGRTR